MLVALRDHVASWGPISMERILSETQRSQLRNGTEQRDVGLAHSEPTLPLPLPQQQHAAETKQGCMWLC